eukprot:m.508981 g.508981  ORF g.508981 m.508981 type:complete len:751 (+) comp21888_c2_seq5:70-2322(+)
MALRLSSIVCVTGFVLVLEQCSHSSAQSMAALPNGSIAIQLLSTTDTFLVQQGSRPAVDILGVLSELAQNHSDVTSSIVTSTNANIQEINMTLNNLASTVTDNYETMTSQGDLITRLQDTQTQLLDTIAAMNQCATNGTIFDPSRGYCIQPASRDDELSQRLDAVEDDIVGIDLLFNQTGGNHSVCTICPVGHYMVQECSGHTGTQCAPCPNGTYSIGGFARECLDCSLQLDDCEFATCTSRSNARCARCSAPIVGGQAYIAHPTTGLCTVCPLYTYRSSPTTCSVCPTNASCALAECQANSGTLAISGIPGSQQGFSGLNGWNTPGGLVHSSADANPWFEIDINPLGDSRHNLSHVSLQNRDGPCGSRTFGSGRDCVSYSHFNTYDDADEGAIFGVSDTSLSTITDLGSFNPPLCSATVRRNCIIMRLRQPNTNPMTNVTYNIPFNGASGRYVYMLLPSGDGIRIINVVRMLIVGSHIPNTPGVSICRAECAVDGCTNATCVYTPPATTHVATCPRDACSREFTGGQAIEYNSATRQCSACSASQYLARTSVGYQCASCPASCSGSRCQRSSSNILTDTGSVVTQSSINPPWVPVTRTYDGLTSTWGGTYTGNRPWWQVQFQRMYTVLNVTLVSPSNDCAQRFWQSGRACGWTYPPGGATQQFLGPADGILVKVSNASCVGGSSQSCPGVVCARLTTPGPSYVNFTYNVRCTSPVYGRYVSVSKPGYGNLDLAEVTVNIADDEMYAPTC